MSKKKILITSDDGFDSLGIRLLIRALRDDHDISVVGTLKQQSGVGGMMHFSGETKWGTQLVDGVEVLWVDGTPGDGMAVAQVYFEKEFDLIISGINWGSNVGGAGLISSGTYGAVVRGIGSGVAPKGIAISWDVPPDEWFERYEGGVKITQKHLDHPGDTAEHVLNEAMNHDLWGSKLININLPKKSTKKYVFTKTLDDLRKYYAYPESLDKNKRTFSHIFALADDRETDPDVDVVVISGGKISITPCVPSMVDVDLYEKLKS